MPVWAFVLIIVGSALLAIFLLGILPMLIVTMPIADKLYKMQWTRQEGAFPRGCSDASFDYHLDMFNQGMAWREENIKHMKEVEIVSEGIKLVGEYFDFGLMLDFARVWWTEYKKADGFLTLKEREKFKMRKDAYVFMISYVYDF